MQMKTVYKRKILVIFIIALLLVFCFDTADAQSGFEFYFFGQNFKSFQDCNWLKVAAGAVASVFVHELGHALYLELSGKSWDVQTSFPSGFAVRFDDLLDDRESVNFGRAGFALQTFIGMALTTFEITKRSDFTKGLVGMNTVQIVSYKSRTHDIGDDFVMIDRGGGGVDLEFAVFSFLSITNQIRLESDLSTFLTKIDSTPNSEFYNITESVTDSQDVFLVDTEPTVQIPSLPAIELPHFDPQEAFAKNNSHWWDSAFVERETNQLDFSLITDMQPRS